MHCSPLYSCNFRNLFESCERYFAGGLATALIAAKHYIICGLIGGHVKMFDISQTEAWHRIRLFRVLAGHNDTVTCLSTYDDVLASGARDRTIRLWNFETGAAMRVLKAANRYLEGVSLTRDTLISLHYSSAKFETNVYKSKAVLWRIGATYDAIDEVSVTGLDNPPIRALLSHALNGKRLAYALLDTIKVTEVVGNGFHTLAKIDLGVRTFVKELHLSGNLLVYKMSDHLVRFKDVRDIEGDPVLPQMLASTRNSSSCVTSFGFVMTFPEERKAVAWHWVDLLESDGLAKGTELNLGCWKDDISFNKKDSVLLSPKGIVFLDQLSQGFHAFWFRNPNEVALSFDDEVDDLL